MSKSPQSFLGSYSITKVGLLLILSLLNFNSFAQSSSLNKVVINTRNNGQSNNPDGYIEYLPVNYNNRDDWPILIWHHGLGKGGNGSSGDLNKLLSNQIMNWLKTNDVPFVVLSPQDYNGYFGNGKLELFYNWAKKYYANKTDKDSYHVSVLSASGAGLATFLEDNNLAAKEVATVTINGALTGTGNNTIYTNVVNNNTKVWFHHGDADGTVGYGAPLNFYRGLLDKISGQDFSRFRFTLYAGLGHSAWEEVYDNSGQNRNKVTGSISGGNYGNYYNWTSGSWYDWMLSNSKSGSQAAPTVNAGTDKLINLPTNSINITGTASSSGGTIASYQWTKLNGPSTFTQNNQNTKTISLSDLVEGIYNFRLTATDDLGQTGYDDVKVTVNNTNQNPVVNAGSDKTIILPVNSVSISGSSSDPDGTIASKVWTQRQGPSSATLSGVNTNTLNASDLIEGTYRFRLTATDDDGASSFDQVDVIVNPAETNSAPTANAGEDLSINLPTNSTNVIGSGSDADGSISSYLWEQISGPSEISLTNTNNSTLSLSNLTAGTYQFQLTVTDDDGASDSDQMTLEVIEANSNPDVNAGNDQQIALPTNSTIINGFATDADGSIDSYLWTQISGPNTAVLTNENTINLSVSNLVEGSYIFSLTVTDNEGAEASDQMTVTVSASNANIAPTVNAGDDISLTLPTNSVQLNGSATDADGVISNYLWSKVSGPSTFSLLNPASQQATLSGLISGIYIFKLTATDNDGASNSDQIRINVAPESVNQSPIVNAGPDISITLPTNTASLSGTATDSDGSISSYQWTQVEGPNTANLSTPNTASTEVSNLLEGSYVFSLEVTDDDEATNTDQLILIVNAVNVSPTVSAGVDIFINLPTDSVAVIGKSSDSDGNIVSTNWTQINGPSPTINIINDTLKVSNLTEGMYTFQFSATDNNGASSSDNFNLTVSSSTNILPTVNAGNDRTVNLPTSSINLTANAFDLDGTIQSYLWEQTSGNNVALTNINNKTLSVTNLSAGDFIFKVTVIDNDGGAASDEVMVTVQEAEINQPPLADAGNTRIISLPINSSTLTGIGFDADGSISSYLWSKKSGPAVTLNNATTATVSLSDLLEGTYTFEFKVTDNEGLSASDQVQLIVNPEELNQNPTANAGNDISIVLPNNATNLSSNAFDPDGEVISYQWTQISGPNTAVLANSDLATTNISGLIEGDYIIKLTVSDNSGAIDEDELKVSVLAENSNIAPVANAGKDIDLYLPTNSINIVGTGSDDDGNIQSYSWIKISGPSTAILNNSSAPTLNLSSLTTGIYEFQLTVTDNDGTSHNDRMKLRVFSESTNQSPSVYAGTDKSVLVSVDSIKIQASAFDPDGTIANYLWTKSSGPNVNLKNTNTTVLTVNDLVEGIFNFRVSVTDNDGAVNFDEIKITVLPPNANTPPIANAGDDITLKLPTNFLNLNGSGQDEQGPISSFFWEQFNGPTATLQNQNSAILSLSDLSEGSYSFSLEVTDSDGLTDRDEMTLIVLSESINLSPTVDAGADQLVDEGSGELIFNAVANDEDGSITSYNWQKNSGPEAELVGTNSPTLSVTSYPPGNYEFSVTVIDNKGAAEKDVVQLSVFELPTFAPPIVFAGNDTTIMIPADSIILRGLAESETLLENYRWEQLSGPSLNILPIDSNQVMINKLRKGNYMFLLTVTDIEGQSNSDDVSFIIKDDNASNDFPIVFTPNNDGFNDQWIIEDNDQIANCSLKIFNPAGQLIYESNDYKNDWGGNVNGFPLSDGAYYYIFNCPDRSTIKGAVRIIR